MLFRSVISVLSKFEVRAEEDVEQLEAKRRAAATNLKMHYQHAETEDVAMESSSGPAGLVLPFTRDDRKVGRNEFCPCGSGKKYKHCHGSL